MLHLGTSRLRAIHELLLLLGTRLPMTIYSHCLYIPEVCSRALPGTWYHNYRTYLVSIWCSDPGF